MDSVLVGVNLSNVLMYLVRPSSPFLSLNPLPLTELTDPQYAPVRLPHLT